MNRRKFLAGTGTAAISVFAGCTVFNSDEESGIPLGSLFVHNPSDNSQSVQLQLRREDEVVYEDEVEAAGGYEVIDPSWSTEPAEYTLLYATDEQMGMALIPADFERESDSADCYHAMFNFYGPADPVVELFDSDETDEGTC